MGGIIHPLKPCVGGHTTSLSKHEGGAGGNGGQFEGMPDVFCCLQCGGGGGGQSEGGGTMWLQCGGGGGGQSEGMPEILGIRATTTTRNIFIIVLMY